MKIAIIGTKGVPACYDGFETCADVYVPHVDTKNLGTDGVKLSVPIRDYLERYCF